MIIWIDAQLSPSLASWIATNFEIESHAVRELGLHGAKDHQIFQAARDGEAVVMTKDSDFLLLLDRLGPPTPNPVDHLWQHIQCLSERNFERQFA